MADTDPHAGGPDIWEDGWADPRSSDPRASRGKTLLAECAIVAAAAGVARRHDDPGMADSLTAFAADLKDRAKELLAAAEQDQGNAP
jgi:hypothetical protein